MIFGAELYLTKIFYFNNKSEHNESLLNTECYSSTGVPKKPA